MKIDEPLLTGLLAPFLLMQGCYVRVRTPKLNEPEGERGGIVGSGESLRLLLIGDSAGAGVGASHQREALSGQLVSRLAGSFKVRWRLDAKDGNTTLDTLSSLPCLLPYETDVVIVSLGVNDVTALLPLEDWLAHQDQLLDVLFKQFKACHVLLNAIPPLHRFPALPQPLRWFLGRRAMQFNSALQQRVEHNPKVSFFSMPVAANPSLFAEDGFHPNTKAYELWAELLSSRIAQCLK